MTPQRAYRMVRTALKQGVLVRPQACNRCALPGAPASDGRATIHAHHHDYNRPLDVEWICAKCHRAETPLPEVMGAPTRGERHGNAKLTEAAVLNIRSSALKRSELAATFGVHPKTIQKVRNGKYWLAASFAKPGPQP